MNWLLRWLIRRLGTKAAQIAIDRLRAERHESGFHD